MKGHNNEVVGVSLGQIRDEPVHLSSRAVKFVRTVFSVIEVVFCVQEDEMDPLIIKGVV